MGDNVQSRVARAVSNLRITDNPHPLIVKAAEAMDICGLWAGLACLDAFSLRSVGYYLQVLHRSQLANRKSPQRKAADAELKAILNLETIMCSSDHVGCDSRELGRLLSERKVRILFEMKEARHQKWRVDESERTARELKLRQPHGPARRRRENLVPIAIKLNREHDWTYKEIASLVVGVSKEGDPGKLASIWFDHPCPETRDYWNSGVRTLAEQLPLDVYRS